PLRDDGEGVGHAARLLDGLLERFVVGDEVPERAVLVALRDVRVDEPALADLLEPAGATDDAPDYLSRRRITRLDRLPSRIVAQRTGHRPIPSIQVRAQLRRAPQLVLRARFDLPDAFAREVQTIADLLERARLVVLEPEAEADDLALLAVEIRERCCELVEVRLVDHLFVHRRDAVLLEQIAELARHAVAIGEGAAV